MASTKTSVQTPGKLPLLPTLQFLAMGGVCFSGVFMEQLPINVKSGMNNHMPHPPSPESRKEMDRLRAKIAVELFPGTNTEGWSDEKWCKNAFTKLEGFHWFIPDDRPQKPDVSVWCFIKHTPDPAPHGTLGPSTQLCESDYLPLAIAKAVELVLRYELSKRGTHDF